MCVDNGCSLYIGLIHSVRFRLVVCVNSGYSIRYNKCFTFLFVPGHVGIKGNETAEFSLQKHCGRCLSTDILNDIMDTGWTEFASSFLHCCPSY